MPPEQNDWRPLNNYKNNIKGLSTLDVNGHTSYAKVNRENLDSLSEKHRTLQQTKYYNYPLPSILGSFNLLGYHTARYRDLKETHQIRDTPKVNEFDFLVPPVGDATQMRVDSYKTGKQDSSHIKPSPITNKNTIML